MPIYEFACEEHGAFEVFCTMRGYSAEQYCPECAEPAQRVFTPPNVHAHTFTKAEDRANALTFGRTFSTPQERDEHMRNNDFRFVEKGEFQDKARKALKEYMSAPPSKRGEKPELLRDRQLFKPRKVDMKKVLDEARSKMGGWSHE